MDQLIALIDQWQPRRIMVVGDFMLDRYTYGDAERLSPEAPVPVLHARREETGAGGAANVSVCMAALKLRVRCIGVRGNDDAGRRLGDHLEAAGCDASGIIASDHRPTTVKQSLIGLAQHRHPQKMFRLDFESKEPLTDAESQKIIDAVEKRIGETDLLCLEDYNKGVLAPPTCQRIIAIAKANNVPVLIDPAAISDYTRYRGANCITPNRTEAEKATELPSDTSEQHDAIAQKLVGDLHLESIVLTLDRSGALLLVAGQSPQRLPTEAREVYDVTGAGDMVLAALAGARANGAEWPHAVGLANLAAGLEVEQFGIVPIPLDQVLLAALRQQHDGTKLRTIEQLKPELNAHRRNGKKVAFTNGCFDILHTGHVSLLAGAKSKGDLLVLAVNSDISISSLKGPSRPILPEGDRVKLLEALESVDYVVLFGDGSGGEADTPKPLLRELRPDVLVKGGQYNHDDVVGWEIVESYGGTVVTIPHIQGRSTTDIVERIKESL